MHSAINARLLCAAEFTRQNATFADIGTDHAYLPLFLLDLGRIKYAYCCDINEGPLASARRNAEERGRLDRTEFILTDGATALAGKGISDYAICGMGGELIADIIEGAPFLRSADLHLILQPMTKQDVLRRYLASRGFKISREKYTVEGRHNYVTMLAEYVGEPYEISDLEAEIGLPPYLLSENPERLSYVLEKTRALEKVVRGKELGGKDVSLDKELLNIMKNLTRGKDL